jgi:hypothetical protein
MGVPPSRRQTWCKACEVLGPIESMQPVSNNRPADLGTLLSDRWLCRDEATCLARYAARNKGGAHLYLVTLPAEVGVGDILLITGNPRKAHQHAAAYGACLVRHHIDTDYRR